MASAWRQISATATGPYWRRWQAPSCCWPVKASPCGKARPGLLLRFRRPGPALVVGFRDRRQLFDERCDRPDLLILDAGQLEARHARHVDAVLDDPEQLCRREAAGDLLQVGRIGM